MLATSLLLLPYSSAATVLPWWHVRATLALLGLKGRADASAGLRLARRCRLETLFACEITCRASGMRSDASSQPISAFFGRRVSPHELHRAHIRTDFQPGLRGVEDFLTVPPQVGDGHALHSVLRIEAAER